MSVLIADARASLHQKIGSAIEYVSEVLFADDTLIVDEHGDLAEQYMYCIRDEGLRYGLDFNWDKLSFISVNCSPRIRKPNGDSVKQVQSMVYLGALLTSDGRVASELGRKIGLAYSDFAALQRIWSHANIPLQKKIVIFNTLILSKQLYSLETI